MGPSGSLHPSALVGARSIGQGPALVLGPEYCAAPPLPKGQACPLGTPWVPPPKGRQGGLAIDRPSRGGKGVEASAKPLAPSDEGLSANGAPTWHACRVGRGGATLYLSFGACPETRPTTCAPTRLRERQILSGLAYLSLRHGFAAPPPSSEGGGAAVVQAISLYPWKMLCMPMPASAGVPHMVMVSLSSAVSLSRYMARPSAPAA